jgi:hypothetical protein
MSANEEEESGHQPLQEGEAYLIKGRVAELEREQEEARKRDEDYKKRQTLYSKRVAWFTAALVLTSLITDAIYFDMSCTARKTADAAKSAAETAAASLRPWIKIEKLELTKGTGPIHTLQFHWPSTGAVVPPNLQLTASFLNVGHSVAQDVEVAMELFFAKFESDKWHDVVTQEEQRFCGSAIYHTEAGITDIVFPSDSWQWHGAAVGVVPKSLTQPAASLIMCVGYRGAPRTRYQTQARFGLYENNAVFIPAGVDADIDGLKLIRDEEGDHAY